MTESRTSVLADVSAERDRQEAKWGEQNHPDGTGAEASVWNSLGLPSRHSSNQMLAHTATDRTNALARNGRCTYEAILTEEWAEAVAAAAGSAELRAELVQVAAVAVAWVEKLDREVAR